MVGSPEEQSHSLGKFVDLEAPESLERGQNLYDQPPFAEILTKVEDEVGITRKDLATFLSMVSHGANSYKARPGQR